MPRSLRVEAEEGVTVIGRIYTTGAGDNYHLRTDCYGLIGGQDSHRSRSAQVHRITTWTPCGVCARPGTGPLSDIVGFLTARLDEKAELARLRLAEATRHAASELDPERALREVEAVRRIVADFAALDADPGRLTDPALELRWNTLRLVLATLALPYDRHPDCEEWRP